MNPQEENKITTDERAEAAGHFDAEARTEAAKEFDASERSEAAKAFDAKEPTGSGEELEDWREELYREQAEKRAERKRGIRREALSYVWLILGVIAVVFFVQTFILINARIPSESMETTIMSGDHIFGNRLTYRFHDPERYDIVIFRYPDNEEQLFIKRVIGLPGDVVEIRDGRVYVNGSDTPLDDSFCNFDPNDGITGTNPGRDTQETLGGTYYRVPENCYFMLGDNRDHSRDSRFWMNPYVAKNKILGKAVLRYWPISRITVLKHDQGYYRPPSSVEES